MRFTWDEKKNASNYRKHGVDFTAACEVFDDPFFLTAIDTYSPTQERWQMIGMTNRELLLFVVHTRHTDDGQEIAHIISARKATKHERRIYEKARY